MEFTSGAKVSQPLFNHIPNDDKSLETFGQRSSDSTKSGQKRDKPFLNDTEKIEFKKQRRNETNNSNDLIEDLSDVDMTIETISSKISILESGLDGLNTQMATVLSLLLKEKDTGNTPGAQLGTANPKTMEGYPPSKDGGGTP